MNKDKLPPIELYRKYLNIASIRFNLTIDQCRDKYGLYTIAQWDELFKSDKTEMDKAKEWAKKITFLRWAYERYNHCLTEDQLILAMYRNKDKSFYELNNIPDPSKKEQVKEVDILEENKRLKEVNKLLVDIAKTVEFWFNNEANYPEGTNGYNIKQKAQAALKEANLIK